MKIFGPARHAKRLRIWSLVISTLTVAVLAGPLRAETPVFPPGSHVGLLPPAGFDISTDFTGFANRDAGASIVMTELPREAYGELESGFTQERLAAQGMTLLGTCDDVSVPFEFRCYRVGQVASGHRFMKWLLVARLNNETALLVATVPEAVLANGLYADADFAAALSSLTYSEDLAVPPRDALPFTIEEGPLLSFQRALGGSAALFSAESHGGVPQALMIVAASLDSRANARDSEFGRRAFQQIETVSGARIEEERPVSVGSLSGHVFEGSGTDEESGYELFVFQAILVDAKDTYYRLVGLAPVAEKDLYRPEFLRLMRTLQPR